MHTPSIVHATPRTRTSSVLGQRLRLGLGALIVTMLGWAAIAAPGCASHGRYTAEHESTAKVKMEGLKAASEYKMGEQAFLAAELPQALKHVDYSLSLNGNVAKTHVLRGRILMEMGDLENSGACFKKAHEVDAKSVESEYYQGILAERIERYTDALAHYKTAAGMDATNPQYAIAAAEIMVELGDTAGAEAFLLTHSASFDHNAGVRQTLGHIAMMRNEPEKAVKLLGEAHLLAPDDQAITEDLIRAQVTLKRYAEAEFNISRLLTSKENKDRRDLRHVQADCLMLLDRPVEAREIVLNLTTDSAGAGDLAAWTKLGQVSYILRDYTRVKQAAARVVALAPESADGYILKALSQRKAGDLAGARKSIVTALGHAKSSDAYILKGMIETELSDTVSARQSFAEAVKLNPTDANASGLLAAVEVTP